MIDYNGDVTRALVPSAIAMWLGVLENMPLLNNLQHPMIIDWVVSSSIRSNSIRLEKK